MPHKKATGALIAISRNRLAISIHTRPLHPSPRPARTLPTQQRWKHTKVLNSSLATQGYPQTEASHSASPPPRTATPESSIFPDATTPTEYYIGLVESGSLRDDDHQRRIVRILQNLHDRAKTYTPPPLPAPDGQTSIMSRLFARKTPETPVDIDQIPRGVYLFGDVGTGKTMLMDLFYKTLPRNIKRKRRVHFHSFMIDVHKRVHRVNVSRGYRGGDQVRLVAREIATEATVLCFDEFQVTDITDAMILGRLVESLMEFGVVCVFTSNRHPDDLYKNGIQRASFVPTIELLKTRYDVLDLNSGVDYRRIPRALSKVYFDPITDENRREIEKIFQSMTYGDPSDPVILNRKLEFWGRSLSVPESTTKIARFTFDDLCRKPLSSADFLEITKHFTTIFLTDVPKLGPSDKDMARRFIHFVDACYESKTKLFVLSDVPIFKIFADDTHHSEPQPISHHMRSIMDDLGLPADAVGSSSLFTIDEEIFAFARACSRLIQMGSKEWAETAGEKQQ